MAESRRDQITATALAKLAGITAGNGYRSTLRRVSQVPEDLDAAQELPCAILTESAELDEDLYEEATLTGQVDALMHLRTTLYVKGSDAAEARRLLNRLEADVAQSFGVTLDLDGVIDVRRVGREGDGWAAQDMGWRAWRALTWQVHYTYTEGQE